MKYMNIGIFDSGLGGLWSAKSIIRNLPNYSYVYLGDTARLPYGNRSADTVYKYFCQAIIFFFERENCAVVVVACNTVSAEAVQRAQEEFLPKYFPGKLIVGVIGSIITEAIKYDRVGVIATIGTVDSKAYQKRIHAISKNTKVFQQKAPLLVPIIEEGEYDLIELVAKRYLSPLLKKDVGVIVLGCTHYAIIKNIIQKIIPKNIKIISQDDTLWKRLEEVLNDNIKIKNSLCKKKKRILYVTEKTPHFSKLANKWFPDLTLHETSIK